MRMDRDTHKDRWMIRPDGKDKVTGKLRYLTDLSVPGMLYGRVLRSRHPHALILAVDTREAKAVPGVLAVLTAKDVPGWNRFGISKPDQPVFCDTRVRNVGDAVAAVAAESPEAAEAALRLIRVDYEPLPGVHDPEKALEADAVKLHPEGNLLHSTSVSKGEVESAWASCVHIVEETYYTPRQLHLYMETEGGLFVPEENGRLTVYSPTQHGYKDRMQLARILAVPEPSIRVVSSPIGGSFGGKDELNIQPYGALLALATGRPVKIHNSRRESMRTSIKRHPMKIRMRTGADAEGRLIAHEVHILADTGAYATLGREVLQFATEHAAGAYRIPHVEIRGRSAYTNNGVAGEYRGFGGNQVIFAVEGQMDRLAEKLGMDPWEFRRLNLRHRDDPGPLGQIIVPTDGALQVWEKAAASPLMKLRGMPERGELPWLRRGVGAAVVMHGGGLGHGIPDPAGGRLSLTRDGRIEAAFGFEEFGQGILSVLTLLVKERFGCSAEDIQIAIGDTDAVPHTGSATASRATAMAWQALQKLAPDFEDKVLGAAAKRTGRPSSSMRLGPGGIWLKEVREEGADEMGPVMTYAALSGWLGEPVVSETTFAFPVTPTPDPVPGSHFLYTYGSVVVEVEVNLLTGKVQVLRTDHAVAAGPVVNPMGFLGQIEGGSIMALGFTLTEDVVMQEGEYVRGQLDTYMIPTVADIPEVVRVEAVEELPEGDAFGPRGVGEIGTVALAPAVAAAIRDACGQWVERLPVKPERLAASWMEVMEKGVTV
ncbi:xanthine dehydrogenase subunit D [Gorillibacterium sp. sgz5001074]|uniref:xanthine dehydrogenase subunit D n=1 Tax=Gorillibacterium sp. sgz5001074 TaxID=3446695 RepID=UPI003F66755C